VGVCVDPCGPSARCDTSAPPVYSVCMRRIPCNSAAQRPMRESCHQARIMFVLRFLPAGLERASESQVVGEGLSGPKMLDCHAERATIRESLRSWTSSSPAVFPCRPHELGPVWLLTTLTMAPSCWIRAFESHLVSVGSTKQRMSGTKLCSKSACENEDCCSSIHIRQSHIGNPSCHIALVCGVRY
jgi:hypothetical protein